MLASETLNLSIGDVIADHRLSTSAVSGEFRLYDKPIEYTLSADAVRAIAENHRPILAQIELYFSCLVRKQLRFQEIESVEPGAEHVSRLIPGFYAAFRAVTTAHCKITDRDAAAPTEQLPVKNPQLFLPAWLKIDFRAGQWVGEYGFTHDF